MRDIASYLPTQVNQGAFLTGYTRARLEELIAEQRLVLPICSLGVSVDELKQLGPLVLPPLYHEALDATLKHRLVERIEECFPYYLGTAARGSFRGSLEVVELPSRDWPDMGSVHTAAFSVDTAVEEHGPHLPLMTDTLQSYAVLRELASEDSRLSLAPPVEYGHLTWGLPFGLSIDITPSLLTQYVAGFLDALVRWLQPSAVYVVDVHGSIVHRRAIQDGMELSDCRCCAFRWLHEPLASVSGDRGDQHGGGVETALVEWIDPRLVDRRWWPDGAERLAAGEMAMDRAIELSTDLPRFIRFVEEHDTNGIVGRIDNYRDVRADLMVQSMLSVAREDLRDLHRRSR